MTHDPHQPPPYDPQQPQQAYVPMATMDYGQLPPPAPTSVMVIGIIGIVLAALTLICVPISLAMSMLPAGWYEAQVGGATVQNSTLETIDNHRGIHWWTIGSNIVHIALGLMLLIASIGAVRLRAWGRSLSIAYAWTELIFLLISTIVTFGFILPLLTRLTTDPSNRGMVVGSVAVGGVLGVLIGAALPIAILICYRRANVIDAFRRNSVGR